ncbi:MAG TPA: hypothetical protein ENK57_17240, partial [Polyangiaceae bacterium]|nr:hypothetical protein [Polyangiaceae bacterium]
MRGVASLTAVLLLGGCSAILNLGELQGGAPDGGEGLDAGPDAAPSLSDASLPDAGPDASLPDAGPIDAGSCTPGVACTDNPGAPCMRGEISCDTGAPVCTDASPADGTACGAGADSACVLGECLGTTIISGETNLGADSTIGGACADGVSYGVSSLPDATTINLATAPGSCLAAGDEVLLINLQGAGAAVDNVGNWELLRVASVSGVTVTVATGRTRSYGSATGSDSGIGAGEGRQHVALIRVPRYGQLRIGLGATLTANPFDGQVGGVVALRAGTLEVNGGEISAAGLGYRNGRGSIDQLCRHTVTTESGESISGLGSQTTGRNHGAPGGFLELTFEDFNGYNSIAATPGHSRPGEVGAGGARTPGEPGLAYGV